MSDAMYSRYGVHERLGDSLLADQIAELLRSIAAGEDGVLGGFRRGRRGRRFIFKGIHSGGCFCFLAMMRFPFADCVLQSVKRKPGRKPLELFAVTLQKRKAHGNHPWAFSRPLPQDG